MTSVGQAGARQQIELPAMPGAGQDLAFATPDPLARSGRKGGASQTAEADRRELVRAEVQHSHVAVLNIEDTDQLPLKLDDPPRAGRNLSGPGHDIPPLTHQPSPAAGIGLEPSRASHGSAGRRENCAPRNPAYPRPSGENRSRT